MRKLILNERSGPALDILIGAAVQMLAAKDWMPAFQEIQNAIINEEEKKEEISTVEESDKIKENTSSSEIESIPAVEVEKI